MNESSFRTLTNLTLAFVTTLHVYSTFENVISAAKERYIDTFHGDTTLSTLVNLTRLRVLVVVQGNHLITDSPCCDYPWSELFDEAKRIGDAVATLKKVQLMLHIHKQCTEFPPLVWIQEVPADPHDDLPDFVDVPDRDRFETADGLGHSLKVAVSTGVRVDARHPRMGYIERNF